MMGSSVGPSTGAHLAYQTSSLLQRSQLGSMYMSMPGSMIIYSRGQEGSHSALHCASAFLRSSAKVCAGNVGSTTLTLWDLLST
jgi:hypothetical protein